MWLFKRYAPELTYYDAFLIFAILCVVCNKPRNEFKDGTLVDDISRWSEWILSNSKLEIRSVATSNQTCFTGCGERGWRALTILPDMDRSIIGFHQMQGIRCIIVLAESRRVSIRRNRPRPSYPLIARSLNYVDSRSVTLFSRNFDHSAFIYKNLRQHILQYYTPLDHVSNIIPFH